MLSVTLVVVIVLINWPSLPGVSYRMWDDGAAGPNEISRRYNKSAPTLLLPHPYIGLNGKGGAIMLSPE